MNTYFAYSIVISCLCFGTVSCRPSSKSDVEENKLHFLYYPTPEEQVEIVFNDTNSLQAAKLKPACKTILLIDGFTAPRLTPMTLETKDTFTKDRNDTNVIIVDWSAYSGWGRSISDPVARALAYLEVTFIGLPKAAKDLADFINFLNVENGISFDNIVMIGHSMGCHTAGYAGKTVISEYGKPVSRIIGLDPSFQISALDSSLRLHAGDASVVEVYITNREWYGDQSLTIGDVNIFVNGGNDQPCRFLPEESAITGTTCSDHRYSWKFYNYLAHNETLKACPCKGAACLCKECSRDCGEDGITIGPNIPQEAFGSYHVKSGKLDWST